MIPTDKIERKRMIERMLQHCVEASDDLNQWEDDFIESVMNQFESKGTLSDRQCEILEKIYDKL